jgi:hypothetical protein
MGYYNMIEQLKHTADYRLTNERHNEESAMRECIRRISGEAGLAAYRGRDIAKYESHKKSDVRSWSYIGEDLVRDIALALSQGLTYQDCVDCFNVSMSTVEYISCKHPDTEKILRNHILKQHISPYGELRFSIRGSYS